MRVKMKKLILIVLLLVSTVSSAQFVNSKSDIHNVQYVKDHAIRYSFTDRIVNLQGYIVEQIREDYFLFKDETGSIRVEIYGSRMPSTSFSSDDKVMITGEVDLFFLRPEIYVTSVLLLDQENEALMNTPNSQASSDRTYKYDRWDR
jgi:uncharacterized protein (TIGR00156 family)